MKRVVLSALTALSALWLMSAQAKTVDLGSVPEPSSWTLENHFTTVQSFDDIYSFTISKTADGWGGVLDFNTDGNTILLLISKIALYNTEGLLAAQTTTDNFRFSGLTAGTYSLHVMGSVAPDGSLSGSDVYYNGTLNLTLPTAVPEPGTLALFGLGLAGAGLMGRRRKLAAR
jgi:hypothetical protein